MGTEGLTPQRARVLDAREAERRRQARVLGWLALVVLAVGFTFSGSNGALPPGVFAEVRAGSVVASDGDQTWVVGDRVAINTRFVAADGEARLLTNWGELTLAPSSVATGYPARLDLAVGEVLVDNADQFLGVSTPELYAQGVGTWRVAAGLNPRVAFYAGGGAASSFLAGGSGGGATVTLTDFEQARGADRLVLGPFPIVYSAADAWDARLLAGPLAVDAEAAKLSATADARWSPQPRPVSFYARFEVMDDALVDALERFATTGDATTYGIPGDVLTAVFATRALVDFGPMPVLEAIDRVDTRRADAATWGITLAMDGVGLAEFLSVQDLALRAEQDRTPLPPPQPVPSATPTATPTPTPTPTSTPTQGPTECPAGQVRQDDGTCAVEPSCPDGQVVGADGECVEPCPSGQERTPAGDCRDPREVTDCVDDPDAAACTVTNVIEDILDLVPDPLAEPVEPVADAVDGLLDLLPGDEQPSGGLGSLLDGVGRLGRIVLSLGWG